MKVLFCTNSFARVTNGPAKFAYHLSKEANGPDFEVRILTEDIPQEINGRVYKLKFRIHPWLRYLGVFKRMIEYHKMAMTIREHYPYDVLVYNNAMIGLISFLFAAFPVIGMINDDNNASASMKKIITGKQRAGKRIIFKQIERIIIKTNNIIIVNSRFMKDLLARIYGNEDSYRVMYKGVENELINQNRLELLTNKIKDSILFVKADYERGGINDLISALNRISRKIQLTIVGVDAQNQEKLIKKIKNSRITVKIFAFLPQEDIYKLMRENEIFCVPSRLEAFGVANLEALACGCKVVSSKVGGIPEAIGNCGWLSPPRDVQSLRDNLIEALDYPLEKMSDSIQNHLQNFSIHQSIIKFKTILKKSAHY